MVVDRKWSVFKRKCRFYENIDDFWITFFVELCSNSIIGRIGKIKKIETRYRNTLSLNKITIKNKYFNRKSNRQWCGTLWPCINKSTSWEISSMGAIYIWFLAHSGMLKSYFYLMEIPFTRVLSIGSRFSILIVGISAQHIL